MKVEKLGEHLGAEIRDVDIADLRQNEFDEIHAAWLEHLVLRFRNQPTDDAALKRFSNRFGPLELMPMGLATADQRAKIENPYVTVISNIRVDGKPIGGLRNAEANWHSDMTYVEMPPTASVLLAVEVPETGGDTHFASQYAALAAMPDELRARLATITIKHDAAHTSVDDLRFGFEEFDDPRDAPGAVHPAICLHPETQRPALYLGRRKWAYVTGKTLSESEALLDEVWQYATQPEYTWTQQWQVGDVVVWDNRCVLHRRDGFSADTRRLMRRCQVLARDGPLVAR